VDEKRGRIRCAVGPEERVPKQRGRDFREPVGRGIEVRLQALSIFRREEQGDGTPRVP
jgi:hypothetical protein